MYHSTSVIMVSDGVKITRVVMESIRDCIDALSALILMYIYHGLYTSKDSLLHCLALQAYGDQTHICFFAVPFKGIYNRLHLVLLALP